MVVFIGPITSEELRAHGITSSMEPENSKMGRMVKEAADRAAQLLGTLEGSGTQATATKCSHRQLHVIRIWNGILGPASGKVKQIF